VAHLEGEGDFLKRRRRYHRRPPELIAAERDMGWLVGLRWPQSRRDSEGDENWAKPMGFLLWASWFDYFFFLGLPSARPDRAELNLA
jgi:hypothetical protein